MILSWSLILFSIYATQAFQLSVQDTATAETPVLATWARDVGDPQTFGLMQMDVQAGDIVSVAPVPNLELLTTGTLNVTFEKVGRYLVAIIPELALSSGQQPQSVNAGILVDVVAPPPIPISSNGTAKLANTSTSSVDTGRATPSPSATSSFLDESFESTSESDTTPSTPSNVSPIDEPPETSPGGPDPHTSSSPVIILPLAPATISSSSPTPHIAQTTISTSPGPPPAHQTALSPGTSVNGASHRRTSIIIAMSVLGGMFMLVFAILLGLCVRRRRMRRRREGFHSLLRRKGSLADTILSFSVEDVEASQGTSPLTNFNPDALVRPRSNSESTLFDSPTGAYGSDPLVPSHPRRGSTQALLDSSSQHYRAMSRTHSSTPSAAFTNRSSQSSQYPRLSDSIDPSLISNLTDDPPPRYVPPPSYDVN